MKIVFKACVLVCALVVGVAIADASPVAPGATVTTPKGNKVTNTGTLPIDAQAHMSGGIEVIEVTGDGAHVELLFTDSAAEVAGNDTTIDHGVAGTEADVEGHNTTVNNATTTVVTTTSSGAPHTHSSR